MPERIRRIRDTADVLEQGDILFFHRPGESIREDEDRERFFLILHPSRTTRYRLVLLGRKRPPPHGKGGERFRGLVDAVFEGRETMRQALEGKDGAARAAGEGVYAIARHGNHVHLAYSLEHPDRAGPLQRGLGIEEAGSYILNVKNPDVVDRAERPAYPGTLREKFQGRKYLPADPAGFLDVGKAELLFIVVRRAVEKELGIQFSRQEEPSPG